MSVYILWLYIVDFSALEYQGDFYRNKKICIDLFA